VLPVPRAVELHPGVGHVERAVLREGDVVEQERAERPQVHGRERIAGAPIEAPDRVDVRHPESIAHECHAARRVQADAVPPALDEPQRVQPAVGGEPADEAVAVLHRTDMDVADEPDPLRRIPAGALRDGEPAHRRQSHRTPGDSGRGGGRFGPTGARGSCTGTDGQGEREE
jgi:hypothetical protein